MENIEVSVTDSRPSETVETNEEVITVADKILEEIQCLKTRHEELMTAFQNRTSPDPTPQQVQELQEQAQEIKNLRLELRNLSEKLSQLLERESPLSTPSTSISSTPPVAVILPEEEPEPEVIDLKSDAEDLPAARTEPSANPPKKTRRRI